MRVTITIEDAPGEDTITVPSPVDGGDDAVPRPRPLSSACPTSRAERSLSVPTDVRRGRAWRWTRSSPAGSPSSSTRAARPAGAEQGATSSS